MPARKPALVSSDDPHGQTMGDSSSAIVIISAIGVCSRHRHRRRRCILMFFDDSVGKAGDYCSPWFPGLSPVQRPVGAVVKDLDPKKGVIFCNLIDLDQVP